MLPRTVKIIAISFILIAFALYFSLPMISKYPKPTGMYAVGHQLFHFQAVAFQAMAGTKDEANTYQPDQFQEFNVDIFYPSSENEDQKFAYRPEYITAINQILAQHASEKMLLPEFVWKLLLPSTYEIYAKPNAQIVQEEFPVIVYLPGIGGVGPDILYLEELASHGYIVCSIQPPADIAVTLFPDGRKVLLDQDLKKAIAKNDREFIYHYRDTAHKRWSHYIEITFDKLTKMNVDQNSPWHHRLDLKKFGVFGCSQGGAVALDFCQKHSLCKAGIDMDGWTKTYNSPVSFTTPFLILIGQKGGIIDIPAVHELAENNKRSDFFKIIIDDARHSAFVDDILLKKPWSYLFGQTGDIEKIRKLISYEIVTFFGRYLKGR